MSDSSSPIVGEVPTPAPKIRGEVAAAPFNHLASFPARAATGLVWVYQKTVSPALAAANPLGGCRFAPTCSHYASEALREHGLLCGLALTVRRLVKCGPWHSGGLDPVPTRQVPSCRRVTSPFAPHS